MAVNDPKITIRAKNETDRAFKAARSNLLDFKKSTLSLTSALAGLAGAAGFGAAIKASLDAQDQIGKLSTRIGASTEALSQYKFVAEQTGVSFQTLTMGWQRMTRRVAEAANGTGEAKEAIKELGLEATALNQLAPEKQFEALAQAIRKVEQPADQVRLAMKLFDSEGVALLQTIKQTADETANLKARADELGLTLSQEQTAAAARANDAMNELKSAFNGMTIQLTESLGPAITEVVKLMTEALPEITKFGSHIVDRVGIEIAAIWDWLNPSDVTGPTTLEESFARVTKQLVESRAEMAATTAQAQQTQQTLVDTGIQGPDLNKADLKALSDFGFEDAKTRQHLLDTRYEQNRAANAAEFAALWEFEDRKTALVKRGARDRLKFSTWSAKQQTRHVVGEAVRLTAGVAHQSKTLFKINKIAGTAQAIINTHKGVSESLATYPWPLAGAMAALHFAAGMAQVRAIQSASYGGGGAGSSGLTTAGGAVVPQTPPSDFGGQLQTTAAAPQIQVFIEGSAIGNDQVQELVVAAVETALENDQLERF